MRSFALRRDGSDGFDVLRDRAVLTGSVQREVALGVLDAQIRAEVALRAPDAIFVHAGVVAHRDPAIVIPGSSFTGKTTLVAALVRAGATYFSDEFAVLDERGCLAPYAKPLSLRPPGQRREIDNPASALGGAVGESSVGPCPPAPRPPSARCERWRSWTP